MFKLASPGRNFIQVSPECISGYFEVHNFFGPFSTIYHLLVHLQFPNPIYIYTTLKTSGGALFRLLSLNRKSGVSKGGASWLT